jgi:hypothetical protein
VAGGGLDDRGRDREQHLLVFRDDVPMTPAPPLSGRWQQGQLGTPRPRRVVPAPVWILPEWMLAGLDPLQHETVIRLEMERRLIVRGWLPVEVWQTKGA